MGAFTAKPAQGILIDGKKYKDGASVRGKSKVDVGPPDTQSGKGVKIAVRITQDQEVAELTLEGAEIQNLPRHHASEAHLDSHDPAAGKSWRVWLVPRELLPRDLKGFKTTFRLTRPRAIQTVKWAVVYADQEFSGGFMIFGFADVGWKGAEKGAATRGRRSPSPRKPCRPKRSR